MYIFPKKSFEILVCEIFFRPPPKLRAKSPPMCLLDSLDLDRCLSIVFW